GGATSGSSGTEQLRLAPGRARVVAISFSAGCDEQLHLVERRVYLLSAVADALDDLANRIRADAVLPCNVVDFVRLTSRNSGAIRFSALALTVGHLLLLCLSSLQQYATHSIIRRCAAYISIRHEAGVREKHWRDHDAERFCCRKIDT